MRHSFLLLLTSSSIVIVVIAPLIFLLAGAEQHTIHNCASDYSAPTSIARPNSADRTVENSAILLLPLSESLSFQPAAPTIPAEAASALAERPSPEASEMDRRQAASDKNQRMDELLDLPSIPADYGARMVALYRDDTHDVLTCDFAVQHIGLYAQALHRAGTYDAGSDDARLCRAALFDAAGETRSIVAAAALRALSDLAQFDPQLEASRLDDMLVSCVGDDAASTAARVMATQLCGERAIASSRASLGHILDDPSAPVPLRKAAQWSLSFLEKDSP